MVSSATTLLLCAESSHRQEANEWEWLCFSGTLFAKTKCWPVGYSLMTLVELGNKNTYLRGFVTILCISTHSNKETFNAI